MPPLVTCIIPVWNGEEFLAGAIESVLAQDHRPIEVLVVDDGSTDGTAVLAESYGDPVRLLRQANAGAPAARNHGIREARGDYLAFLDGDDLYRPAKLSTQLRILGESPLTDLCICTARNFWEPGLEDEHERYAAAGRVLITHHFATQLAHRSVFDRVGPISESTSADYAEWFLRATDAGLSVRVIPDVLLDRRMHAANTSRSGEPIDDYFAIARSRIDRTKSARAREPGALEPG